MDITYENIKNLIISKDIKFIDFVTNTYNLQNDKITKNDIIFGELWKYLLLTINHDFLEGYLFMINCLVLYMEDIYNLINLSIERKNYNFFKFITNKYQNFLEINDIMYDIENVLDDDYETYSKFLIFLNEL